MTATRAGLVKRLMAILYDALLLLALLFIVGIIVSTLSTFMVNDGNAITEDHTFYRFHQIVVLGSLLLTGLGFFGWFWTHGGQTLGMRTWRIQMVDENLQPIGWRIATIHFFASILSWMLFGLGYLWCLIDSDRRCLHDRISGVQLLQLEKKKS